MIAQKPQALENAGGAGISGRIAKIPPVRPLSGPLSIFVPMFSRGSVC